MVPAVKEVHLNELGDHPRTVSTTNGLTYATEYQAQGRSELSVARVLLVGREQH